MTASANRRPGPRGPVLTKDGISRVSEADRRFIRDTFVAIFTPEELALLDDYRDRHHLPDRVRALVALIALGLDHVDQQQRNSDD